MAEQPTPPASPASPADAQTPMPQRTQAGQPTPPGQPGQPQGDQPDQGQPHQAEQDVLLDLARQMRQKERIDNQVSRTVVFTEEEANAMAEALEQLAPRVQKTTASAPPSGRLQPEARR